MRDLKRKIAARYTRPKYETTEMKLQISPQLIHSLLV